MLVSRFKRRAPFGALLGALVLASCSKGGDATTPPVEQNPNQVGPSGGTVQTSDKRVSLSIPAGAVANNVVISVTPISNPTADARVAARSVYEFGPDGTQFAQPVTLKLAYDEADLPAGTDKSSLRITKYVDGSWKEVDNITVDSLNHTVSGQIHSFSTYGVKADPCKPMGLVVGGTQSGSVSKASCLYPNGPTYSDYYDFTASAAGTYSLTSAPGTGFSGLYGIKDANADPTQGLVWVYGSVGKPLRVALNPGAYQVFVSGKDTTVAGSYSITSGTSAEIGNPSCTSEIVALQPGTSNTATFGDASCEITIAFHPLYNGKKTKADYYLVKLVGGKPYTFTAEALTPGTNVNVALFTLNGTFIDGAGNSGTANPKTLTFTPQPAISWVQVEVTAWSTTEAWNAPLGSYRVSVGG